MKMKRWSIAIMALSMAVLAVAQAPVKEKAEVSVKGYELEREMPVFLDRLKEEITFSMAWGNCSIRSFKKWRKEARKCVYEAMQVPPQKAESYDAELVTEELREGYKARKYRFNLTAYSRVEAYVLVPDGEGPHPAVVLLHDHGGHFTIGKEKMIRPFDVPQAVVDDADDWAKRCYGGQYMGDYLAKNGYVVISVDALFWGDRGRKEGVDGGKYAAVAGNFMMLGRNLSGWMNYEDIYTTNFLKSLPEVDGERIGCMGFSMGGYRSWMLSALTDDVKTGVSICFMNVMDDQLSWKHGKEKGAFANTLPTLRPLLDYPHVASIACPKPMFFLNGEKDGLFHPEGVRQAFDEMHRVWKSQGVDERLRTELWDMPHDCGIKVQEAILEFFKEWL